MATISQSSPSLLGTFTTPQNRGYLLPNPVNLAFEFRRGPEELATASPDRRSNVPDMVPSKPGTARQLLKRLLASLGRPFVDLTLPTAWNFQFFLTRLLCSALRACSLLRVRGDR